MSEVTFARCYEGCMIRDGVLIPGENCKEHYGEVQRTESYWREKIAGELANYKSGNSVPSWLKVADAIAVARGGGRG